MQQKNNIDALITLGNIVRNKGIPQGVIKEALKANHLFTADSINCSAEAIANDMLQADALRGWLPKIQYTNRYNSVLIVMAGNIPMVGFFDMLCCVSLGITCYIKPSTKDKALMEWCISTLCSLGVEDLHLWNNEPIEAVIATGSNNSARYFEHQFGSIPRIVRKNRSSVAVIDGTESTEEIQGLWHDIFDYLGLGCRSVTHLMIPEGYDITPLLTELASIKLDNIHFANAYRQAKALKILNGEEFFDGGYFIATESENITPPMAEITYSTHNRLRLESLKPDIQVVIGREQTEYGQAQHPTLNDWPDGINLFSFLIY